MAGSSRVTNKIGSLQRGNCNSRISWSKNGTVAFISGDGNVFVTYLTCEDGESWGFSSPTLLTNVRNIHQNVPVVHVAWSSIGGDLACIDIHGRISISALNAAGVMASLYSPAASSANDSTSSPHVSEIDAIVGFSWLDPDKPILLASPATRTETPQQGGSHNALYGVSQGKQVGPAHPVAGKQACIALTRRGCLKLISQIAADARYYQTVAWLELIVDQKENDLISHATWKGCRDNSLLVVTMIPGRSLVRVYKVAIQWSLQATGKPPGVSHAPPNEFARIAVERIVQTSVINPMVDAMYITHLQAIPVPPYKSSTQVEATHELYTVYSNGQKSMLQRYEITSSSATLHPNFYQLGGGGSRSSGDAESLVWSVSPVDSPVIHKVPVLSIGTAGYDTYLNIMFANGSVQSIYRPQPGLTEGKNTIVSLGDVGYKFPVFGSISEMCLSANLLSYAYIDDNDVLKVNYMENTKDANVRENVIASAIALAVRHSISCFSNISGDDILVVMKRELQRIERDSPGRGADFLALLLQESHRAINFTLDIPRDYQIDKIVVNPSLQRLLSMQMILGTASKWKRDATGRIAWGALNLRLLAFGLTFTLRATSQTKHTSNGVSEVEVRAAHILSMVGLIRWCTDFLAYTCQELYVASIENEKFYYDDPNKPSIVMCLLLCRVPRTLLIFSLRGIRGLESVATKLAELDPSNTFVSGVVQQVKDAISSSLVPLNVFEKMVTDLDTSLKAISAGLPDRLAIEQALIFHLKITNELHPVVKRVLEVFRKSLVQEIDIPKLYFHDVSWLGLDQQAEPSGLNELTQMMKEGKIKDEIDVLRKQIISVGTGDRPRRCVRCGGYSVWDDVKSLALTQWTVAFQKTCLCGGNWSTVVGRL